MTRVKGGTIHRARRAKVLDEAKGYFGSKHRLYRTAKEQLMHSGHYAYRDRRQNKRDFRKLWITRINAACRENEISYSKFIDGLNKANVVVNRKMLSEVAIDNPKAFTELVNTAKKALEGKLEAPAKTVKIEKVETKKAEKPAKEVKKAPKKAEPKKETKTDLSKSTLVELKEMAKAKEIKGYSTMKKAELIDALK